MSTLHLAAFSLDPVGPAAGDYRVILGGSWYNNARQILALAGRSTARRVRRDGAGFRLARTIS